MKIRQRSRLGSVLTHLGFLFGVLLITALILSVITLHREVDRLETRITDERQSKQNEKGKTDEIKDEDKMFRETVESVDTLLAEHNSSRTQQLFEALTTEDGENSLLSNTGLRFRSDGALQGTLLRNKRRYFRIQGREVHGDVLIESRLEKTVRLAEAGKKGREFVLEEREHLDRITASEREMRSRLTRLVERDEVREILEAEDMQATRIVEDEFTLRRGIVNAGGAVIVRIAADAKEDKYRIDGKSIRDDRLALELTDALEAYDPQDELRNTKKQLEKRLSHLIDDKGFQAYLNERDLEIEKAVNEPLFSIRYPLVTGEGNSAGAFVLDPEKGVINLENAQGTQKWTLTQVPVTHGIGGRDSKGFDHPAFLLLGEHEGLSDTIVLVKPGSKAISMISIPRDLYYGKRKINEMDKAEGPKEIMTAVSEISGIEVDHYVKVDLDGFSELVNALGTITVDLEKELLDPNMHYRTKGERRMLYFSRGKHEIGGNAALALARSRSTTSDFSRARRQQLILEGIRRRIDQLSLTEAGKLYDLLQAVFEYTDTDMGMNDMLRYYRRYRDIEKTRRVVLSSENVLHSTYLGLHARDMELKEAGELDEEQLGAWILRPIDDDWDLISWYVNTWISGMGPDVEEYLSSKRAVTEEDSSLQDDLLRKMEKESGIALFTLNELPPADSKQ